MLRYIFFAIVAAYLALPSQVFASRVSPLVIELADSGRGAVSSIEVANTQSKDFAVELRVFRADIGERAELQLEPADEQFLIFPTQAIIESGKRQRFRVQYLGEGDLEQSAIYYVSVNEVAAPVAPGQSKIQILTNFNVLVNVVPDNASASPRVTAAQPVKRTNDEGEVQHGIEFRVFNEGNRFFAASRSAWNLQATTEDGERIDWRIPQGQSGRLFGFGIVPPKQARIFFVPTTKPVLEETVTVRAGS